jgi:hypothetical protein
VTNPVGRPLKYETPDDLDKDIQDYFETDAYIDVGDARMFAPTVEGLAYHLGMTRQTLLNYEEKEQFFDTIKRAKQRIGIALEQRLYGNNVTGIIFNLKNNFGWKDKTETEHSGTVGLSDMTEEQINARLQSLIDATSNPQ